MEKKIFVLAFGAFISRIDIDKIPLLKENRSAAFNVMCIFQLSEKKYKKDIARMAGMIYELLPTQNKLEHFYNYSNLVGTSQKLYKDSLSLLFPDTYKELLRL